ncbi:hypothetical protein FOZ63_013706 [Perkinsus olseni]|uniref:Uncharacterized protein n=1 Tax=Perkinsus olseni TaxID=32597 RepID=A0A7J6RGE5_PEROL|nr:hypothetical protein FOZ63_013706 [Perkinsus olseni]KAF4719848.1 hypothetical protein FOZ62_027849 [Perkinsus olseni]
MGCNSSTVSEPVAAPEASDQVVATGSEGGPKVENDVAMASNVTTGKPSVSNDEFPYLYGSMQDKISGESSQEATSKSFPYIYPEASEWLWTPPLLPGRSHKSQ